jgi:hypothetical protein
MATERTGVRVEFVGKFLTRLKVSSAIREITRRFYSTQPGEQIIITPHDRELWNNIRKYLGPDDAKTKKQKKPG